SWVLLEHAAGTAGSDRPLGKVTNGFGLVLAGGHDDDVPRIHDCRYALSQAVHGNRVDVAVEEPSVVTACLRGECLDVGTRLQPGTRLVEADVPVTADSEDLQVDATTAGNRLLIVGALGDEVVRESVGSVYPGRVDVDLAGEVSVDHIAVPLGMLLGESDVVIQQVCAGLGQRQSAGCYLRSEERRVGRECAHE